MTTETTKQTDALPSEESVPGGDCVDRIVRLFTWLALNGALAWCAWEGVNENVGAGRVLVFAAWFFAFVYWLAAAAPKHVTTRATAKGRSVPGWISQGYNAVMIVFLVWHGWWCTGIAFVLLAIAEAGLYHKPNIKP